MTRPYEEIEATLDQVAATLAEIQKAQKEQLALLERLRPDHLPSYPLVPLYKRPPYAPSDC